MKLTSIDYNSRWEGAMEILIRYSESSHWYASNGI